MIVAVGTAPAAVERAAEDHCTGRAAEEDSVAAKGSYCM